MPSLAETTSKLVPLPLQLENGVHVSIEQNISQSVTLITGDIVVGQPTSKPSTVTVIDASTKEPVPFNNFIKNGHHYVVPHSAQKFLDSGTLDIELFNVAKLQRYTNTSEISSWRILVKYKKDSVPINFGGAISTSYIEAIQTQIVTVNNSNAQRIWQLLVSNTDIKKVWFDETLYAH